MGMGEPLANYSAFGRLIEMLNAKDGFGLSARSMTVSTAGLIPGIERLSGESCRSGWPSRSTPPTINYAINWCRSIKNTRWTN